MQPDIDPQEKRSESVIFQGPYVLQFICHNSHCRERITWSRCRTEMKGGRKCDCLVDRVSCQGIMMAARCPHCRQLYSQRLRRASLVPNELLEQAPNA